MANINDLQLRILEKAQIECTDCDDLLGDYVADELPATLRARLENHIARCECCQEGLATYQMVIELAQSLPKQTMPPEAKKRLRQALSERVGINLSE